MIFYPSYFVQYVHMFIFKVREARAHQIHLRALLIIIIVFKLGMRLIIIAK